MSYSEEYDAEILQLRISNATIGDSNFQFTCVYRTGAITSTLHPHVGLKVWAYPTCSLSGDVPSVISFNETLRIFMECSCTDRLTLSWLTVNGGIKSDLHGESTFSSNLFQDITADDQGRKYICEATIADDSKFRLTCSIVPYNPRLVVSIISHMATVDTKDIFVLVCINTGTFSPETKFLWYYNSNMILNDLEDERIQITQTETNSTLVLGTTYLPPGNTTITCKATIPGVNSASVNVSVTVEETPGNPSTDFMLVTIAAATAGGLLVAIILLILITCYYLRRRRVRSKNNEQFMESPLNKNESFTKETVQSNPALQSQVPCNTCNIPNSNTSESAGTSQSGFPTYAMPNKPGSSDHKAKQEMNFSHYDGVGGPVDSDVQTREHSKKSTNKPESVQCVDAPSDYDDVSLPSKILSQTSASKQSANAEGLMYADLDISTAKPSTGNGNNDEILGKDNLTVYSEVRM